MNFNYFPEKELIKPSEKIEVIQVLRGIAVIMVIIFHFKDLIKPGEFLKNEMDFFFNSGAAGVDLFFVISGFIMVFVTRKSAGGFKSFKTFLIKRIIRVWPMYIIATITYALIVIPTLADTSRGIALRIIKSIFFIPLTYTDPPYFGYPFLGVGWSLNYEIYFYILIAITLLITKYRWPFFLFLVILTLVFIPAIFGNLILQPLATQDYGSLFLNLITNPIIWEFVYGVIIGLIYINPGTYRFFKRIFKSRTVLAIVISLAAWQCLSGFFGGHGPLYWGLSMAVLFLASVFYCSERSITFPAWMIYLGDISFSVYLWHIPMGELIKNIFLNLSYPVFSTGTPAFLLTISMTLIFSHLSYQFLEKRLNAFLSAKLKA